jgi:energy-converting hydrogenase Eha subunit A
MNDFFLVLSKTIIFVISFIVTSKIVLEFLKNRNPAVKRWDIEVVVVSTIIAAFITSISKNIIKYLL